MKLPSVAAVTGELQVSSLSAAFLMVGVGLVVGATLALTDANIWPAIQRARMRVQAAA